jgi:hypothetical protein
MDPGLYEDLAGRLYGLLIWLEDRLNCDDASVVHQFIDTGRYGLALEEIAKTLAGRTIGITDAGRAGMLELADRVDALARAAGMPLKGDLVREWMTYGQRLLRGTGWAGCTACSSAWATGGGIAER